MRVLVLQRVKAKFRLEVFNKLHEAENNYWFGFGSAEPEENIAEFQVDDVLKATNVKILSIFGGVFYWFKDIKKIISSTKPDVVIITPTPRILSNFWLVILCRIYGIKLIGWGMGEMPGRKGLQRNLHKNLQKTLVRLLDGVICYGSSANGYYKEIAPNIPREICYNTINVESTKIICEEIKAQQKENNFLSEYTKDLSEYTGLRIVFLGRIIASKQIEVLMKALINLNSVHVTIIGDGESKYQDYLNDMFISNNVSVKFVGHLEGKNLADTLLVNDVCILPGRGGLAINHAMAHGLPVICTTGDGTEIDLVINGYTGWRFNEGDADALRLCIIEAIEMKRRNSSYRMNIDKVIHEKYLLKYFVTSFDNAITKISEDQK